MQTGISVERQLTKNANLAVTYLTSRGVHEFFTENINAPDAPRFRAMRPPRRGRWGHRTIFTSTNPKACLSRTS